MLCIKLGQLCQAKHTIHRSCTSGSPKTHPSLPTEGAPLVGRLRCMYPQTPIGLTSELNFLVRSPEVDRTAISFRLS